MAILFSRHGKEKLKERNIPDPNKLPLKGISKRLRRKVRESCKTKGCDTSNYVYFVNESKAKTFVFVTAPIPSPDQQKKDFKLITALLYEKS